MSDNLRAELEALEPMWPRGMYGCPQDMFGRSQLRAILDRTAPSEDCPETHPWSGEACMFAAGHDGDHSVPASRNLSNPDGSGVTWWRTAPSEDDGGWSREVEQAGYQGVPSEDEREALKGAAEAVLSQAITNARETEKAGAWSEHDRLVALGALDHLNANILSALVRDAILAAGFRRIDPTDEALVKRCAEAFEGTWNGGIQDFNPETDDYDAYIRMCIRAALEAVTR